MKRILTYSEAILEATRQEMERDPSVIVYGLGVNDPRGIYGTTRALHEQFGNARVFDTPISEDAMTGVGIGAALTGLRPIHVHIRMDFLLLAMNQIVNIAAKSHYMYGGAVSVPIVVRSIIGRSWGQGAQHSQGLHALFMHIPGLRVVAPTTPYDAKGCLIASIRDNNPVLFVEHRMVHNLKGHVPEEAYVVPLGQARILAQGDHITIIGISHMAVECMRAQHELAKVGVSAEVIDPVCLSPLDMQSIFRSVERTKRLLIVDSGWLSCGASAEILASVAESVEDLGQIKLKRMGYAPVPCPTTPSLERLFYPNAQTIAQAAYNLVKNEDWAPEDVTAQEVIEFRGPF